MIGILYYMKLPGGGKVTEAARRVLGAKHIITKKSGHYVQLKEPELVIGAIREVARMAGAPGQ